MSIKRKFSELKKWCVKNKNKIAACSCFTLGMYLGAAIKNEPSETRVEPSEDVLADLVKLNDKDLIHFELVQPDKKGGVYNRIGVNWDKATALEIGEDLIIAATKRKEELDEIGWVPIN